MGLTDFEDRDRATTKISQQPQVHAFVEGFKGRKVYVFGRVMKPGTMTYENGMSLIEVITKAGGLHDLAAAERTTITRVIDGKSKAGGFGESYPSGRCKECRCLPR